MMRKPDISALIHEKLKLFDNGLRDRQLIHPRRDWFSGLVAMLLLIGIAGLWSGRTYLNNYRIEPDEPTTDTTAVVYRGQLVAEVLASRQDEARKFNQLLEQSVVQQLAVPNETGTTTVPTASSTEMVVDAVSTTTDTTASSTEIVN
ncbi:hypothetical protein KC887_01760 [Candidatus Kaiserbacteria bacterium]|nr:hypothetical protein [Candidatus Kaiserbacteria bacterium]